LVIVSEEYEEPPGKGKNQRREKPPKRKGRRAKEKPKTRKRTHHPQREKTPTPRGNTPPPQPQTEPAENHPQKQAVDPRRAVLHSPPKAREILKCDAFHSRLKQCVFCVHRGSCVYQAGNKVLIRRSLLELKSRFPDIAGVSL